MILECFFCFEDAVVKKLFIIALPGVLDCDVTVNI